MLERGRGTVVRAAEYIIPCYPTSHACGSCESGGDVLQGRRGMGIIRCSGARQSLLAGLDLRFHRADVTLADIDYEEGRYPIHYSSPMAPCGMRGRCYGIFAVQ